MCIVSEKWVDANPKLPRSTTESNVYKTAIESGLFSTVTHLYLDECIYTTGVHIDNVLVGTNYDVYFFSFIGNSLLNPTALSLKSLKGKKIFLWPDTVWPWIFDNLKKVNEYADLHTSHDFPSEEVKTFISPKKIVTLGTPQDPTLFTYSCVKDIDVSFIGTMYGTRPAFIKAIEKTVGISSYIGQGSRVTGMSLSEYASIMKRSKIVINLTMSPAGKQQLKGRSFEAMACNSLLLEENNNETSKCFSKFEDYDVFDTPESLVGNILYYLQHEDKRKQIALNGHVKYMKEYSAVPYWKNMLNEIS